MLIETNNASFQRHADKYTSLLFPSEINNNTNNYTV